MSGYNDGYNSCSGGSTDKGDRSFDDLVTKVCNALDDRNVRLLKTLLPLVDIGTAGGNTVILAAAQMFCAAELFYHDRL